METGNYKKKKMGKDQSATHIEHVQQKTRSPFSQKIIFCGVTAHNTGPDQINRIIITFL